MPKSHQIRLGGIELQASEVGGDELKNESGCRETDAADVLTLQMRVGGIRRLPVSPVHAFLSVK